MKRTAISIICPLVVGLLMTSCIDDPEGTELSSAVALTSFSIGDLRTTHVVEKENGKDSTYVTIMSGKTVRFTIDQANRQVYNADSIAFGTDVSRVIVTAGADGYVHYLKENGEKGSVEDTISFVKPVTFCVTSYDEKFTREYLVRINVHQVDPKKTAWKQLGGASYPKGLFVSQKAFVKGDSLIVLGKDAEGSCYSTSTLLADGIAWSTPAKCGGIVGDPDCASALLVDGVFYLTANGALFASADAVTWTAVNNAQPIATLLAVEEDTTAVAWGVVADTLASSTDMQVWTLGKQRPARAIKASVASFSLPLRTNNDIYRTLFVGTPTSETDTCAVVWSKLTTDASWMEVEPKGDNIYGCPNLENLAVIQYAGNMYAFGGKSLGLRKERLEAFSACYESRDNGVTWKERNGVFSLPAAFKGRDESFAVATDGEYVWVMWSTSGEVWRGRWNGIK